jgi:hypothetical protein
MASTIKLKNGSGAPTTGDLVQGEPALDLTNKRLYTENASGVVIEVGTNPSTIDINAGTIDGTVIGGTTAAAGTFTTGQFNTSLNVDGTTNLDVVDIDGAVDMASTLTVGGTTNDGTTLAQIVQSGTGRAFSVNRNVASATRAVVNLAQLQASGGCRSCFRYSANHTGFSRHKSYPRWEYRQIFCVWYWRFSHDPRCRRTRSL